MQTPKYTGRPSELHAHHVENSVYNVFAMGLACNCASAHLLCFPLRKLIHKCNYSAQPESIVATLCATYWHADTDISLLGLVCHEVLTAHLHWQISSERMAKCHAYNIRNSVYAVYAWLLLDKELLRISTDFCTERLFVTANTICTMHLPCMSAKSTLRKVFRKCNYYPYAVPPMLFSQTSKCCFWCGIYLLVETSRLLADGGGHEFA